MVGNLVAVDCSAEVASLNEGNWVTEKIHRIGDTTGSGPADHEDRVSVSCSFTVQLLGDELFVPREVKPLASAALDLEADGLPLTAPHQL